MKEIKGIARGKFLPGKLEEWKRLTAEAMHIYTWDSLHGEIEVFDRRGHHLGAAHPVSGVLFKGAVKGRKIDV